MKNILEKAIKYFAISFFTGLVGIATLVSSTGQRIPLPFLIAATLLLIIVCFIIAYLRNREDILPPDILTDEEDRDKYLITFDNKSDCKFLNERTKATFGKDFVDNGITESWRLHNPKGFLCLKDKNGNICAGLTVLSIKAPCLKCFINGAIDESELNEDLLNDFETSLKEKNLYITLIIVLDALGIEGGKRVSLMLWGFIQYLNKYYMPSNGTVKTIYAMPINKKSLNMLTRFGFTICTSYSKRKDGNEIYSLELTEENLKRITTRIGDYSHLCSLAID